MKSLVIAMSLIASTVVMAKPLPTTSFQNLLPVGIYTGHNNDSACVVTVNATDSAIGISLQTSNSNDTFVISNSSKSVSITNSEVRATQSLSYPHYLNGGTSILNIKVDSANNEAKVFITNILLDHRGNDASTYAECAIAL